MNKTLKKTIAFLLMVYTFAYTLLLSSCDYHGSDNYFPEGYTGGFHIDRGSGAAYYWVETYEECQAAIELLKSHGSRFGQTLIFTYEGELFDTKYCFSINRKRADKIKYGEDPFDRYADGVYVFSYAFYDDVTIDELIYSYVGWHNAYTVDIHYGYFPDAYANNPNILSEKLERSDYDHGYSFYADGIKGELFTIYDENPLATSDENYVPVINDAGIKVILDSLIVVE